MTSRTLPLLLSALLAPAAADGHTTHGSILNTSHPYWIISTSTSRHPNQGLFLRQPSADPESNQKALSANTFDYNNRHTDMLFWIWPVPGKEDKFWLVGAKDSRKAGTMVFLDHFGKSEVWPFRMPICSSNSASRLAPGSTHFGRTGTDPDDPDSLAEWKFIPSTPSKIEDSFEKHGTSKTHYYIQSGPDQRYKNEMLYITQHCVPLPRPEFHSAAPCASRP